MRPSGAQEGFPLAKPNYQFEKRQRDLAKKQKQEEKRRQKLAGKAAAESEPDTAAAPPAGEADASPVPAPEGGSPGSETP